MKKFLIISSIVFLLLLIVNKTLITKLNIYIENIFLNENRIISNVKISNGEIFINKGKGRRDEVWEKININGINIDPAKPGVFPKSNLVSEEDYLRWFSYIKDLKINCIRVSSLMGTNFYRALEIYNEENNEPLYVIQGIYFNDEVFKNGYNLLDKEVVKSFKAEIKRTISAVHGTAIKALTEDLSQKYNVDISKYILGYTIGEEWATHDIIYFNTVNEKKGFKGRYIEATNEASPFEEYIAYLANYAVTYEMDSYREEKLVTFISKGFNYLRNKEGKKIGEGVAIPIGAVEGSEKVKDYLDCDTIVLRDKYRGGVIASYNIYPDIREDLSYDKSITDYINRIKEFCKVPILVSEFGMPTGRDTQGFYGDDKRELITEKKQGEMLVKVHKDIERADILGGCIFELQDTWYKSAFNTVKNRVLDRETYWSDRETDSQWYGILSFDPINNKKRDGDRVKSFDEKNILVNSVNGKLSIGNDERYLYILLKLNEGVEARNKSFYIDFDTTPKSGSNRALGLDFEVPVDFIAKINGDDSELLVQKYYSIYDFNRSYERLRLRPNTVSVKSDMEEFVKIKLLTREKMYLESKGMLLEEEYTEIGKLNPINIEEIKENGFVEKGEYIIDNNFLTLRIPWGLLNFMDPSTGKIEDDFIESFKFTPLTIDKIGIGVTVKDNLNGEILRFPSNAYKLKSWHIPKYEERLKESYYIFKNYINGGV